MRLLRAVAISSAVDQTRLLVMSISINSYEGMNEMKDILILARVVYR